MNQSGIRSSGMVNPTMGNYAGYSAVPYGGMNRSSVVNTMEPAKPVPTLMAGMPLNLMNQHYNDDPNDPENRKKKKQGEDYMLHFDFYVPSALGTGGVTAGAAGAAGVNEVIKVVEGKSCLEECCDCSLFSCWLGCINTLCPCNVEQCLSQNPNLSQFQKRDQLENACFA